MNSFFGVRFAAPSLRFVAAVSFAAVLALAGCEDSTTSPPASAADTAATGDSASPSDTASAGTDAATTGTDAATSPDDIAAGTDATGGTDCGKVVWDQVKDAFLTNCGDCHDVPDGVFKAKVCSSTASRKTKIKSEVTKNAMPPDGNISDADKQLIIQWVNDGGLCACP